MYVNDLDKDVRCEIRELEREKVNNERQCSWTQGEADLLGNWASK